MLRIDLELNKRFGKGYQAVVAIRYDGFSNMSVFDDQPYTLREIVRVAKSIVAKINETIATDYKLKDALLITEGAIESNKSRDSDSAKLFWELSSGVKQYIETQSLEEFLYGVNGCE